MQRVGLALFVGALLAVPASANAAAIPSPARLLALDPGARLGANTIVTTGRNERVAGVLRRPNFIIGLGTNETIVGGASDDEIRAFGKNVTVRGGKGDDLVYGGPGGTLIGGPGHDLLLEADDNGTVVITGKHTEVVLSGHHDRVQCSRGSGNDIV